MTTKQHDEEFKRTTVQSLLASGKSIRSFARDLGVSPDELKEWRRQYLKALPRSSFAVAGFVLGLLAVVSLCCLADPPGRMAFLPLILLCSGCGLVSASIGLFQTNLRLARKKGQTLALTGLMWSLMAFLLLAVHSPSPHWGRAYRAECQNNMKEMGVVFKMYADEQAGGIFPPLSSEPGKLMFDNEAGGGLPVYPEFLTDYNVLLCPTDKDDPFAAADADEDGSISMEELEDVLDDHSYFYLGYVVTNDTEVEAFAEAYRECIADGEPFANNLIVPEGTGNAGASIIFRLGEGVEQRIYGTDPDDPEEASPASEIPVLIERLGNHEEPGGGNVLFLDGHVDFLKYPGPWPMTEKTMGILNSLDAMGENE